MTEVVAAQNSPGPAPAGSLLAKLRQAQLSIDAARWIAAADRRARTPVERRAMSWSFFLEISAALHAEAGADSEPQIDLTSYQIVGDQDLSGNWQGEFGTADPSEYAPPWCCRGLTRMTARSLVETLEIARELTGDEAFVRDADGRPYFGATTVFVSYFWRAPLRRLLSALEACALGGEAGLRREFFWLDIFAVAQCRHADAARAHNAADVEGFERVIGAARATWLWAEPWHRPATFRRVWCLYEVLKTKDLGKNLALVMAPDEGHDLAATLVERFEQTMKVVSSIDAADAEATRAEDKAMILRLIAARDGGAQRFNVDLAAALREWLVETALARLEAKPATTAPASGGGDARSAAKLRVGVGKLLQELGRFADAERIFREVVDGEAARAHGASADDVAFAGEALMNLASALQDQFRRDDAHDAYVRAIALLESALGPDHLEVARACGNHGLNLRGMGRLDDAEAAMWHALAIREAQLGGDDPCVARSYGNLGNLLKLRGRLDEAEPLIRRALDIRERALGPTHTAVALSLTGLADVLRLRGELDAAEDAVARALCIKEAALGAEHASNVSALDALADIQRERGRNAEEVATRARALELTEKVADVEQTRTRRRALAADLGGLGRFDEAAALLKGIEGLDEDIARLRRGEGLLDADYTYQQGAIMRRGAAS